MVNQLKLLKNSFQKEYFAIAQDAATPKTKFKRYSNNGCY